jgi:hypothetical protein
MTENQLRQCFIEFWDEQLMIKPCSQGFIISPPIMFSDGWQVVVYLERVTPSKWLIHDQGKTLALLEGTGLDIEGGKFREDLRHLLRFYQIDAEGTRLQKTIDSPANTVDIQIFAEALVGISHLAPKKPRVLPANTAGQIEDQVNAFFYRRSLQPKRRHKLQGLIEEEIVVDYFVEGNTPLALQTVTRAKGLLNYMEQWGWRWTDLNKRHPEIHRAMIYDPDNQDWDESSLRIGQEVCEVFTPYTQAEEAFSAIFPA